MYHWVQSTTSPFGRLDISVSCLIVFCDGKGPLLLLSVCCGQTEAPTAPTKGPLRAWSCPQLGRGLGGREELGFAMLSSISEVLQDGQVLRAASLCESGSHRTGHPWALHPLYTPQPGWGSLMSERSLDSTCPASPSVTNGYTWCPLSSQAHWQFHGAAPTLPCPRHGHL